MSCGTPFVMLMHVRCRSLSGEPESQPLETRVGVTVEPEPAAAAASGHDLRVIIVMVIVKTYTPARSDARVPAQWST